jgi:hypothetical protein
LGWKTLLSPLDNLWWNSDYLTGSHVFQLILARLGGNRGGGGKEDYLGLGKYAMGSPPKSSIPVLGVVQRQPEEELETLLGSCQAVVIVFAAIDDARWSGRGGEDEPG